MTLRRVFMLGTAFALFHPVFGMCRTLDIPAGVSLQVPDGWEVMPPATLGSHAAKLVTPSRPTELRSFDCGLQPAAAGTGLVQTCILVQVRNTGRFSRSSLTDFPVLRQTLSETSAAFEQTLHKEHAEAECSPFLYDEAGGMLWILAATVTPEDIPMRSLMALVLTEQGVIQVSGFAPAADFDACLPVFESFVRQMKLQPHLVYRTRFSDKHPVLANVNWRGLSLASIVVLALGAGALALVRRARAQS